MTRSRYSCRRFESSSPPKFRTICSPTMPLCRGHHQDHRAAAALLLQAGCAVARLMNQRRAGREVGPAAREGQRKGRHPRLKQSRELLVCSLCRCVFSVRHFLMCPYSRARLGSSGTLLIPGGLAAGRGPAPGSPLVDRKGGGRSGSGVARASAASSRSVDNLEMMRSRASEVRVLFSVCISIMPAAR